MNEERTMTKEDAEARVLEVKEQKKKEAEALIKKSTKKGKK